MGKSWNAHRWRVWAVRTLGAVVALVIVLTAALLLLQGLLEDPIIRYVAARSQRSIRVDGPFQARIVSLHPRIIAERVVIGNPPWMPPGQTADIGHLEVTYDLLPSVQLHTIVMERATLHLARDQNGHSNWQAQSPGSAQGDGPPLLHRLRMPQARVFFNDARRRIQFDGTITAQDLPGGGPTPPLRIEGMGQLNGRSAHFALDCDSLATVARNKPYRFAFSESSSGTLLTGTGAVPRPFDFRYLGLAFEARGDDLKDLYFLTGLGLPQTAQYHLSGQFERQDHHLGFNNLQARSGQSDMYGTIAVDTQRGGAPSLTHVKLRSKLLRMADIGAQAGNRSGSNVQQGRLLSDTPLHLNGALHSIAEVEFHADTLQMGRIPVRNVTTKVNINLGNIQVTPISATVRGGELTGGFKIDVNQDPPHADIDLRVTHLKLADAAGKPAPVAGPLQGRVTLQGRGSSLHDLASHSSGTVTVVLPHGVTRSSLPELAGFDLRGLGLLATGSKGDTGIRCGVAHFDVKDGIMTAQRLLVDTDPVLITGDGTVDMRSEALDLKLVGHPKHPRLRVRAPLLVRGTIEHPSFSTDAGKPFVQAGGALALGVLLTPVAAILAFVDPGLARDSDCGALLAEVQKGGK